MLEKQIHDKERELKKQKDLYKNQLDKKERENNKLMDLLSNKIHRLDPESSLLQSNQTKEMPNEKKMNDMVFVLEKFGKNKMAKDQKY